MASDMTRSEPQPSTLGTSLSVAIAGMRANALRRRTHCGKRAWYYAGWVQTVQTVDVLGADEGLGWVRWRGTRHAVFACENEPSGAAGLRTARRGKRVWLLAVMADGLGS